MNEKQCNDAVTFICLRQTYGLDSMSYILITSLTALQDAHHKRLLPQVYLGLNTLEFSTIYVNEDFVSRLKQA